jgi:hypothetical protein
LKGGDVKDLDDRKIDLFIKYLSKPDVELAEMEAERVAGGLPKEDDFLYVVFWTLEFFRKHLPDQKLPGTADDWVDHLAYCFGSSKEGAGADSVKELFKEYWPAAEAAGEGT